MPAFGCSQRGVLRFGSGYVGRVVSVFGCSQRCVLRFGSDYVGQVMSTFGCSQRGVLQCLLSGALRVVCCDFTAITCSRPPSQARNLGSGASRATPPSPEKSAVD